MLGAQGRRTLDALLSHRQLGLGSGALAGRLSLGALHRHRAGRCREREEVSMQATVARAGEAGRGLPGWKLCAIAGTADKIDVTGLALLGDGNA